MTDEPTQLLSVRETAQLLGVHENTVRNWVAAGILKSARLPGTRFHRFERDAVERLAKARGQAVAPIQDRRVRVPTLADPEQIVASKQESRRVLGPELADATQLTIWAGRREAQGLFPKLVRRLLVATPEVTDLTIRAQEGVGAPGWDGLVNAKRGSLWVPGGRSGWELGTDRKIRDKAQAEYAKRTSDPLGLDPSKAAFVFATPRRWAGAEAWERERRADKIWRDVRVVDADRLEAWLEAVPAVHYWLSEELGLRPRDAITLERWWDQFASRTDPRLPEKLLLAGRESQQNELDQFLEGEPAAIGLQAGSRDEAVGFLAACHQVDNEIGKRSAVVVSAPAVWERLVASGAPMVLVPTFDDPSIAAAIDRGHFVISPLGRQDIARGKIVDLRRLHRQVAHEVFTEAGFSFEQANQLSGLARRSLTSLMRRLAVDPRMARPSWGAGEDANILAPLVLAGAWASRESDQEVIAEIVGADWVAIERCLQRWALTDDPPFTQSGSGWHLTSPEEAFDVLHTLLTTHTVERWGTAVLRVLAETDPNIDLSHDEQLMAGLKGPRQTYSAAVRGGLVGSMALLGALGEAESPSGGPTFADHVRRIAHDLFEQANEDETGLLWRSLSSELPLLAEAAPQQFLDAVDQGLSGQAPLLASMFQDTPDQSFFSASSPHTGLLWSLETLCWSEEFFPQALMALARLAAIDPGGKLGNRPAASLRAVLLPWIPYTAASVEQRLETLRQVRKRYPEVGWQLVLNLLPKHHDHSSPTSSPRFRDWKPDREGVTIAEWAATIEGLVDQTSQALAEEPARWLQVIDHLGSLPVAQRDRLLDELEVVTAREILDPDQKLSLWRIVSKETARHREFPSAQWSMNDESLARLESIASSLAPADTIARNAELFDWRPRLSGVDPFDHETYEAAVAEVRREAVSAVLDAEGIDGLRRLAVESPQAHFVGVTAAEVAGDQVTNELLGRLDAEGKEGQMAGAWAHRMVDLHGADWIRSTSERVLRLRPEGQAAFLRGLPSGRELDEMLEQVDEAVRDRYWRSIHPLIFEEERTAFAVQQLLAHDRPIAAIELLDMRLHDGKDAPEGITADLVAAALRAALSSESAETRQALQGFDYSIGTLINRLETLGAAEQVIAQLEWAYFPLLQYSPHQPRALYAALKRDPSFFVDLVSLVYRGKNERQRDLDEGTATQARNAWSVLDAWRDIPGHHEDGSIDRDHLHHWVKQARLLLEERDRADIGDEQIGQVLSGSPVGLDGAWPAEPVRELIEDIGSRELETGLHIGKVNSRGTTSRGVFDGGQQEHAIAAGYLDWANITRARWPRTTRLLRGLADSYERDARRMDAEAEARANRD